MQLIPDLARATGLTTEQAECVAGTIISALHVSTTPEMYALIERAIPKAGELMTKSAAPLGGRTGEMRAFVTELKSEAGAARLAGQLGLEGLTPAQIKSAVETLVRHLRDTQGIQQVEALLRQLPGFSRMIE